MMGEIIGDMLGEMLGAMLGEIVGEIVGEIGGETVMSPICWPPPEAGAAPDMLLVNCKIHSNKDVEMV